MYLFFCYLTLRRQIPNNWFLPDSAASAVCGRGSCSARALQMLKLCNSQCSCFIPLASPDTFLSDLSVWPTLGRVLLKPIQQNRLAPGLYLRSWIFSSGLWGGLPEASEDMNIRKGACSNPVRAAVMLSAGFAVGRWNLYELLAFVLVALKLKCLENSAGNWSQTLSLVMQTSNPGSHHKTVNKVSVRYWQ